MNPISDETFKQWAQEWDDYLLRVADEEALGIGLDLPDGWSPEFLGFFMDEADVIRGELLRMHAVADGSLNGVSVHCVALYSMKSWHELVDPDA